MTDEKKTDEHQADEWKPPASQAELDRIVGDRVKRERAKFADYDDLKKKAAEVDKAAEAAKSEQEKANERMAAMEKELSETKISALRSRVQARFSISDEDADLLLTARDEDGLVAQAQRIADAAADEAKKKSGPRDSKEGRTPEKTSSDEAETRQFIGNLVDGAK